MYKSETIMTCHLRGDHVRIVGSAVISRKRRIEQGSRERAVEDLLDVLEIRFGLAASDPLAIRIGAIDDVHRLKQLHRAAIQVPSLEAFRPLLDEADVGGEQSYIPDTATGIHHRQCNLGDAEGRKAATASYVFCLGSCPERHSL